MIVWASVDPYRSNRIITDNVDFVAEYACSSNHIDTWLSLESIYFAALLVIFL